MKTNIDKTSLVIALSNLTELSSDAKKNSTPRLVLENDPELVSMTNFANLIKATPFSKYSSKLSSSAVVLSPQSEDALTTRSMDNSFRNSAVFSSFTASMPNTARDTPPPSILKQGEKSRFSKEKRFDRIFSRSSTGSRVTIMEGRK